MGHQRAITGKLVLGAALAAVMAVGGVTATAPEANAAPSAVTRHKDRRAGYVRPVAVEARVSEPWGVRGNWDAGHHTGVDFAVPPGTPVHSVGTGRVVFAGTSGNYGKAVTIHMSDGMYTLFAHLSRIYVHVGEHVGPGTLIGRSGDTGRSHGPHLHFEVRAERGYGSDVDPIAYLARRGVHVP